MVGVDWWLWWWGASSDAACVWFIDGVAQMRHQVRDDINRGAELIKVYVTGGHGIQCGKSVDIISRDELEMAVQSAHERGARVRFVGRRDGVPEKLVRRIEEAEALTAANTRMALYIAFNYGGRRELLDAAAGLAANGEEATETNFRRRLYAPEMHDPELLIRTSGEQRLSDFMLWQSAHSEFYFVDALGPDLREVDFLRALRNYATRARRYGQ